MFLFGWSQGCKPATLQLHHETCEISGDVTDVTSGSFAFRCFDVDQIDPNLTQKTVQWVILPKTLRGNQPVTEYS